MATIIDNKTVASKNAQTDGYTTYQEPDTKIPPKAKPIFSEVSVNGIEIKEADILAEAQNHTAETPGEALMEAARALVIRELLWQEAKLKNTRSRPIHDDDGKVETRKDAAIRALIDAEVDVPSASEDECRRFYDNNPERCKSEAIYEARHILIPVRSDDANAWKKALDSAHHALTTLSVTPEKFGELARDMSECPSAKNGGNLGQLSSGSTVPEFENALQDMQPGSISTAPVKTRFGYHIIALDREIKGEVLPFETIETRLKAWLEAGSWSRAVAQYISILVGKSKVSGIELNKAQGPLVQ